MRDKYTIEEFERIKKLVGCALAAHTKAEAKKYIDQLDYITFGVEGYSRTVLSEVKTATITASGKVRDKERLVEQVDWYLTKFELHCVDKNKL